MRPSIIQFSPTLRDELEYRMDVEEDSDEFAGYPADVLWIHREFMDIEDLGHYDDRVVRRPVAQGQGRVQDGREDVRLRQAPRGLSCR